MFAFHPPHDGFAIGGHATPGIRMRQLLAIVVQIALFAVALRARPFDGHINTLVVLAAETLIAGWLVVRVGRTVRRVRTGDPDGARTVPALRDIVLALFPGPFGQVILGELTIWIGLWRLVSRPFRNRQPEFIYHRRSADYGMLLVVIVTAPVEVLLFELLVPWPGIRWVLLIAALYSVLWFVGLIIAPMVHPHTALNDRLFLRNGAAAQIVVKYSNIASVTPCTVPWPDMVGRFPPPLATRDGGAWLQSGKESSLRINLHEPILVRGEAGHMPVRFVVIAVDEPSELVAAIDLSPGSIMVESRSIPHPSPAGPRPARQGEER